MKAYLDILDNVLKNGKMSDNRTGIKTLRVPTGAVFEHDMANGFPLITTKKMGLKNIATELEFFIQGITDKKWLTDRNCHIWDEWANIYSWKPVFESQRTKELKKLGIHNMTKERETELRNQAMNNCRDLGPIYGFQWRHFGGEYKFNIHEIEKCPTDNVVKSKPGVDQVANAI